VTDVAGAWDDQEQIPELYLNCELSLVGSNRLKYYKEIVIKYKLLVQNFSYISVFQIFNLLIPIITYPYLIRVIGKDTYGLVVFAQAIIGYLVLLVSYGFNISATKEISVHRGDPSKVSEIVSSVLIIKFALLVASCLILSLLILIVPQINTNKSLYFLSLWACVYEMMFPSWYFQGIEQMKFITYINLISRMIFISLIFIFIHSSKDYLFIPLTNGVGAIIAGILSLYIVFGKHKVQFALQPLSNLKFHLNNSGPIFISFLSSKIYDGSSRVIIGSFLGMSEVAYYDLGEKITGVFKIPQSILSQTLFPKISLEKDINFVKKIFKMTAIFHIFVLIFILIFSKLIIRLLAGNQMEPAYIILDILSFTIPIVAIGNILGTQVLIPFGYSNSFRNVIVTSSALYIIIFFLFWAFSSISLISISILTVVIEFYIMAMFLLKCKKYSLWNI
jgi:O-antigen/teichoic acid export membrane protein